MLVCCRCHCDDPYGARMPSIGLVIAPYRTQVCLLKMLSFLHMHQFLQEPHRERFLPESVPLLSLIIAFLYAPEHLPLNVFDSWKIKYRGACVAQ